MQKLVWIFLFVALLFSACEEKGLIIPENPESPVGIPLLVMPLRSTNAVSDTNNLATEYNIVNLNIFLTERGSNTISYKFIDQSFTSINDTTILNCKRVVLPLDPVLTTKDVYVIANCNNTTALNAIQTVADIKALQTPQATTTAGLTTDNGLPMFGQIANANLGASTTANPVSVPLTRACAKLRVTLFFTDASYVGSNNQFAVENASAYTYYVKNDTFKIATSYLLNYPQMPFTQMATQRFQGISYIYESLQIPRLHLYSTINGTATDYLASSNFPLPVRNYLYDIAIQILPPSTTGSLLKSDSASDETPCQTTVRISEW